MSLSANKSNDIRLEPTPSPVPVDKPLLRPSPLSPTHNHPSTSQSSSEPSPGSNEGDGEIDLNDPEELKFYLTQVYLIVKPVICCILLTVLWVKISLMGSDFRPRSPGITAYEESDGDSGAVRFSGALLNALIFIATIVVATIVFVICFKYGYHKLLYGYLFLTVIMILGFIGYMIELNVLQVFNIPMDNITLLFGLYNFSVAGILSIFWRGPLWLQQTYLVLMSSMMAFVLNGFAEWTTWTLLALLAVWDLIAVLCPFGPLKILIDSSREQNRDIPALLYSVTMIYSIAGMADAQKSGDIPLEPKPSETTQKQTELNGSQTNLISPTQRQAATETQQNPEVAHEVEVEDDEERNGLKLGLGDFIFYSVLIARTSMTDWVTTVACFIAVMTGLTATIFLLAMHRKALPALPISIAFGLVFYFASAFTLKPFATTLAFNGIFI